MAEGEAALVVSDVRLRDLERAATDDPEAEERLVAERCRVHGHEILDLDSGMVFNTGPNGQPQRQYPIMVKACLRCGFLEQRLDVKKVKIIKSHTEPKLMRLDGPEGESSLQVT